MKWRPDTEKPFQHVPVLTALMARKGDDGEFYLLMSRYYWKNGGWPHYWKNGGWIEEDTGQVPDTIQPFWWIPESEVLESLKEEWGLKG